MYVDKNTLFSDQDSIVASGPSAVVDLYPGYRGGDRPFIVAYANSYEGNGGLEIQLETSADGDFTASRVVASFPIPASDLKIGGEVLAISLPRKVERYVRLNYIVEDIDALKLSAMLVLDI